MAASDHELDIAEEAAQDAADRLAAALEEAGFDVGVAFAALQGSITLDAEARVELGRISSSDANRLADVLERAVLAGITAQLDEP
jgi:hypothetical protein